MEDWKYPFEQLVQLEDEAAEYVPTPHVEHAVAAAIEKDPAAHAPDTLDSPTVAQYEPTGQDAQTLDPEDPW